jgi:hypothetical protein
LELARMTEPATAHGADTHAVPPPNAFERDELEQFDRDDVDAGKHIGLMLSAFFVYTVIVMSAAGLVTYLRLME